MDGYACKGNGKLNVSMIDKEGLIRILCVIFFLFFFPKQRVNKCYEKVFTKKRVLRKSKKLLFCQETEKKLGSTQYSARAPHPPAKSLK